MSSSPAVADPAASQQPPQQSSQQPSHRPPARFRRRLPTVSPRWTRRVLLANLVAQVGIVATGGAVRVTGSGLGCPTWPECTPGSYTPTVHQAMGIHAYVEFGNRLLTFVVTITAVAALLVVISRGRDRLVPLAAVPLAGVVAQAVIGGVTVLTGLSPVTVMTHFLVSMVLVAASTVLYLRSGEGDGPVRQVLPPAVRSLGWVLTAVTCAVLLLGTVVTGSGPHSGDAEQPVRLGFDPRTVSWLHADAVLLFCGLVVGMIVALSVVQAPAAARRRAWWVLGATLAQGALGYTQYALGVPEVLVVLHMLGAALLVVAVSALVVALRARDDDRPAPVPAEVSAEGRPPA